MQPTSVIKRTPIIVRRVPIITRQAITTPYYRRNSDFNPEFLDKETLLRKYEPLIRSLHKYFCSYAGILDQPSDVSDLYSQIQLEFLNLTQKYDPKRGVDFPGYIKFNLRHRIYYYVTKIQKQNMCECLFRSFGEDNGNAEYPLLERPDESVSEEFNRVEAINSIPWNCLSEEQSILVEEVLQNHKTLDQISKIYGIAPKVIKDQFEELCELLINLNTPGFMETQRKDENDDNRSEKK